MKKPKTSHTTKSEKDKQKSDKSYNILPFKIWFMKFVV